MAGRRAARSVGGRQALDGPAAGSAANLAADADPHSVARAIALRQLAMAPRTRAQLADALARRGVPDEVATAVLDRFEQVDLVDDEEFARQWVSTRHAGRGLSRRALVHELRHRGVEEQTVREAVAEIDDAAELEAARELVRRRLPALRGDDPARRARRIAGLLARRGYGHGLAIRAMRDVLDDVPDELSLGHDGD